ncbi:hypothetical protein L6452_42614 [Arctium lappa]|uniref:Uncharacterized protein n=1 Tax=Arctium lappa TaxID=4217 RepID=A0ACB8XIR1_ARCLA|nr:hypothetical protein L6452_42614 [Arctium lappa]
MPSPSRHRFRFRHSLKSILFSITGFDFVFTGIDLVLHLHNRLRFRLHRSTFTFVLLSSEAESSFKGNSMAARRYETLVSSGTI